MSKQHDTTLEVSFAEEALIANGDKFLVVTEDKAWMNRYFRTKQEALDFNCDMEFPVYEYDESTELWRRIE